MKTLTCVIFLDLKKAFDSVCKNSKRSIQIDILCSGSVAIFHAGPSQSSTVERSLLFFRSSLECRKALPYYS